MAKVEIDGPGTLIWVDGNRKPEETEFENGESWHEIRDIIDWRPPEGQIGKTAWIKCNGKIYNLHGLILNSKNG